MSAVGITENVKGDVKKFEIWYSGREVVYIVQVFDLLLSIFYLCFIAQSISACVFSSFTHTPLLCYGLCVCFSGSHIGGQSCLADGDSKNSHQPAETPSRFLFLL